MSLIAWVNYSKIEEVILFTKVKLLFMIAGKSKKIKQAYFIFYYTKMTLNE